MIKTHMQAYVLMSSPQKQARMTKILHFTNTDDVLLGFIILFNQLIYIGIYYTVVEYTGTY